MVTILPLEDTLMLAIDGEAKRFWAGKKRRIKTDKKTKDIGPRLAKTFVCFK